MKPVEISVDELKDFLFEELADLGYVPTDEEIEVISEIAFDYFVDKLMELEEETK